MRIPAPRRKPSAKMGPCRSSGHPSLPQSLGAATWTATEYGLHRFAMHEMRGRGLASVEHLKHHADVTYFSPTSKKLASAAATTAVAYPVTVALMGRRWATAFTAGLITTYFGYEVAHRRTHTHPPRNRYGRWARRSHLHHHFGAPDAQHRGDQPGVGPPVRHLRRSRRGHRPATHGPRVAARRDRARSGRSTPATTSSRALGPPTPTRSTGIGSTPSPTSLPRPDPRLGSPGR